jgi:hypothetical protein
MEGARVIRYRPIANGGAKRTVSVLASGQLVELMGTAPDGPVKLRMSSAAEKVVGSIAWLKLNETYWKVSGLHV